MYFFVQKEGTRIIFPFTIPFPSSKVNLKRIWQVVNEFPENVKDDNVSGVILIVFLKENFVLGHDVK